MTRTEFLEVMGEVFLNLEEYYPELKEADVRDHVLKSIKIPEEGASQRIYESLRDLTEKALKKPRPRRGPKEWSPKRKNK